MSKRKVQSIVDTLERLAMTTISQEESELLSKEGLAEYEREHNRVIYTQQLKNIAKKHEGEINMKNNNKANKEVCTTIVTEGEKYSPNTNGTDIIGDVRHLNTNGNVEVAQGTASSQSKVDLTLEVENLSKDIQLTSTMYKNDRKAKNAGILDDLEDYSIDVVSAYAQTQLMSIGVNQEVNLTSKEDVIKIIDIVAQEKFEFWAKENAPDEKLLAKATLYGVTNTNGSYWDVHRRVILKRFPVTDAQITSLTENLVALGDKTVKKTVKNAIACCTSFEVSALIQEQNRKVECSDKSFSFINSLEKRLSFPATQKKVSKARATEMIYSYQKQIVLKENNLFGSDEELEKYLETKAKIEEKYKSQILSAMITQMTNEKKADYFSAEDVQSNILKKLATMKLV